MRPTDAEPLGVLIVGIAGGVATTTVAGTLAAALGLAAPRALLTESADCAGLPFRPLDGLVFGGWDLRACSLDEAVLKHGIVPRELACALRAPLAAIRPAAPIGHNVSAHIAASAPHGGHGTSPDGHRAAVFRIAEDIAAFRRRHGLRRIVVVNLASTEPSPPPDPAHDTLEAFERALDDDSAAISNGMLYAYTALASDCAYLNFTPSVTVEVPALAQLARRQRLPYAGKDGKTGQTLYKTVLSPMFKARHLRVRGWYSVNILGNADGYVLQDPRHAATKLESKRRGLEDILGYADFAHTVRIDYYEPAGDDKETWDAIDFEGWLGARMSMRINWRASDSMLAAPLVVDLIRLTALAWHLGESGPLNYLAMFFKSPYGFDAHDFAVQYDAFLSHMTTVREALATCDWAPTR